MQIRKVRIKFDKLLHNTGKAILVRVQNKETWLPNFAISDLVISNKLSGNVVVRASFCDEKEIYYDESMAVEIFHHHIPDKLDKSTISHNKNLDR